MLPKNRKISIAVVAGIAVITGAYFWYRRRKRSCKIQHTVQGNAILVDDIDSQHGDEGEHKSSTSQDPYLAPVEKYIDKQPDLNTDTEDELPQPDEMSDVDQVLNETKKTVLKHMFLVTEGMTAAERLDVYEKLARKINVIQRGEGFYDVKWKP